MSYCNGCGRPHDGDPCGRMTLPEQLDAAQTGEEFGQALNGFLNALGKARWGDE